MAINCFSKNILSLHYSVIFDIEFIKQGHNFVTNVSIDLQVVSFDSELKNTSEQVHESNYPHYLQSSAAGLSSQWLK